MKRKYVTALTITFALAAVFVSGPLIMITSAGGDKAEGSDNGIYVNSAEVIAAEGYDQGLDIDWGTLGEEITAAIQAADRRIVNILTGDTFEIPGYILDFIAGSDVSLALQARAGLAFSVSGWDLDKTGEALKITVSSSGVSETVKQTVLSGASAYCGFSLKGQDALPFCMNAHMYFGQDHADKTAILYSCDEAGGSVRRAGIFRMNEHGQAMFELRQGGSYLVVVMDQAAYTVADGDTLSHIAEKYGITVEALRAANPQIADADMIRPGQMINLY